MSVAGVRVCVFFHVVVDFCAACVFLYVVCVCVRVSERERALPS